MLETYVAKQHLQSCGYTAMEQTQNACRNRVAERTPVDANEFHALRSGRMYTSTLVIIISLNRVLSFPV